MHHVLCILVVLIFSFVIAASGMGRIWAFMIHGLGRVWFRASSSFMLGLFLLLFFSSSFPFYVITAFLP